MANFLGKRRNPVWGTFTDEFTAMFYGTKRMELDHRDSVSMLRDEQAQAAPPRVGSTWTGRPLCCGGRIRSSNPDRNRLRDQCATSAVIRITIEVWVV